DAMMAAAEREVEAVMRQAFGMHARASTRLVHHADGAFLQHTGAHAGKHVVARLALEDDVVDAGFGQKLSKQQSGRTGADDCNLGAHSPWDSSVPASTGSAVNLSRERP